MKRSLMICTLVGSALCLGALAAPIQPEKKPAETTKPAQPAKPAPAAPKPIDKPAVPAKPADNPGAPAQPSKEDLDKIFADMLKLSPEQERFKEFVGTWTAEVRMFEPGAPEQASKGEMVNTLTHGGKFVHHEFKGDFNGMQFTGSGDFGYNTTSRKYESTWMDNFGSMILLSTGTYDAASKTYTSNCEFEMANPMNGQVMKVKQREVVKIESPDKHSMVMYHEAAGMPEMKVMEITYARKK